MREGCVWGCMQGRVALYRIVALSDPPNTAAPVARDPTGWLAPTTPTPHRLLAALQPSPARWRGFFCTCRGVQGGWRPESTPRHIRGRFYLHIFHSKDHKNSLRRFNSFIFWMRNLFVNIQSCVCLP